MLINQKYNLENIKVAIFDFDDTLAIHKDKDYLNHRDETYYLNAYLNPNTFYEIIEPCTISKPLHNLINFLRNNGAKIYCVTGMRFSFHLKAKEHFVHKYYGNDIEVISTKSQELKGDAVTIIKRINNCNLTEILFVDDIKENVIRLNDMGIHALLPDEIKKSDIKEANKIVDCIDNDVSFYE